MPLHWKDPVTCMGQKTDCSQQDHGPGSRKRRRSQTTMASGPRRSRTISQEGYWTPRDRSLSPSGRAAGPWTKNRLQSSTAMAWKGSGPQERTVGDPFLFLTSTQN